MSELIYLYAAYSIIWIGLFVYILKLHLAQRKLNKEIKMIQGILDGKKGKKNL